MRAHVSLALLALCAVALAGCSNRPSRIKPPHIDPEDAAAEALALYDTNGDGALDATELEQCPAIAEKMGAYDSDQDGKLTAEEIAARLAARRSGRVGLTRMKCRIRVNGRPLPGASVVFDPEPFLGGEVQAARGTTDASGSAVMAIPDENLPEHHRGLNGLHMGTYKVRVTHPELDIPSQYNTDTELGHETEIGQGVVEFNLKLGRR